MDKVMSVAISCCVLVVSAVLGFAFGWWLKTKAVEASIIRKAKDEMLGKACAAQAK